MTPVRGLGDGRLLVALAGLAAAAWSLRRAGVGLRTATAALLLWIALTLAPALVGASPVTLYAERYTYVPGMAAALLLGWMLVAGVRRLGLRGSLRSAALAGGVLACGAVSLARAEPWRDDEALYRAMIAQDAGDAYALNGLGLHLVTTGRAPQARPLFERVVALDPGYSAALNALGNFALMEGRLTASADYYRRALEAQPANLDARFGLGSALVRSGHCDEARRIHGELWAGSDAVSRAMQAKIRAIGDPLQGALLRYCR
jgi:tetratricopeptide (TPR) repeat protein